MIDDFSPPKRSAPAKLDIFEGQAAPIKTEETPVAEEKDGETLFKTPEEVAVSEIMGDAPGDTPSDTPPEEPKKKRWSLKPLIDKFKGLSKKKKALVIIITVLVLAAIGGSVYALVKPSTPKPVSVVKAIKKAPVVAKPIVSPLTGMPVTKAQTLLPVTAVMIENSADARPQSGLKDAGVIYEAIAEAGITRFMAVYQETEPGNIGPVRSSRPYYLRWALPYQASYAHVGGSPDALSDIKALGIRDLDQFYNASAYHRITTRAAPHNVYTSISALRTLEQDKGYMTSTFTGFVRKADKPAKTPTATSVDFALSSAFYSSHYDYDAAANSYKRSEGGAAHVDADSGAVLEPKVVVALIMQYSLESDGYHSMYNTVGSGKMFVFQDGGVTTGTWNKAGDADQFVFKDDAGKPLALNAGQTWITALGDATNVTYK
jgi:hypothetical protein